MIVTSAVTPQGRPPVPSKARVLLASRHTLFREGLRSILEHDGENLVVGEATDGVEALRLARQLDPHVLLLDSTIAGLTVLQLLREIASASCRTRTIVLISSEERSTCQKAIESGAHGIVVTDAGSATLLRAVRAVMGGEYWVDHECVADLVQALRRHASPATLSVHRPFGLTGRELEIVSAVSAGCVNKEIAERFSISEKTVKHHLSNIFEKVGVSNRLGLALFALNHGLQPADLQDLVPPGGAGPSRDRLMVPASHGAR